MRRLVLLALLLLPGCAIRPMVSLHGCTVYTFASSPEGVFWKVCSD